jgi:hypothetical protein
MMPVEKILKSLFEWHKRFSEGREDMEDDK